MQKINPKDNNVYYYIYIYYNVIYFIINNVFNELFIMNESNFMFNNNYHITFNIIKSTYLVTY